MYGNFGEVTDFDQAMRFVSDLSVSQRLPYGGNFTAQMISTLVRDVKQSITAEEGSQIALTADIPFLRNAGHIARTGAWVPDTLLSDADFLRVVAPADLTVTLRTRIKTPPVTTLF